MVQFLCGPWGILQICHSGPGWDTGTSSIINDLLTGYNQSMTAAFLLTICSQVHHSSRWKWAVGQCLCEFRSQNSAQHSSYSTLCKIYGIRLGIRSFWTMDPAEVQVQIYEIPLQKHWCCPWSWKNNSSSYNKNYSILSHFLASSCSLVVIKAKSKSTKAYYNL